MWRLRVLAVACAAAMLLGLVACGGRAQGAPASSEVGGQTSAAGRPSAGSADAALGAGGEAPQPVPAPDAVSLAVDGHEPLVGGVVVATCLAYFEGFSGTIGGYTVEFEAYIREPGDYQGDAVEILYLSARSPDGREYCATGGLTICPGGMVTLHARTVAPRFSGSIEAVAFDQNDSKASALSLTLSFDVADNGACR